MHHVVWWTIQWLTWTCNPVHSKYTSTGPRRSLSMHVHIYIYIIFVPPHLLVHENTCSRAIVLRLRQCSTNRLPSMVYSHTHSRVKAVLSHSLIVATGADSKWLGLPGEDQYQGFGISSCATCDGFLFRGSLRHPFHLSLLVSKSIFLA